MTNQNQNQSLLAAIFPLLFVIICTILFVMAGKQAPYTVEDLTPEGQVEWKMKKLLNNENY